MTTKPLLTRLARDEQGFAMVTALLATIVAALLGTIVMQLSLNTTQQSSYDRARTQAIHAAEAGLDQAHTMFASISSSLPCAMTGTLTADPPASWSVTITYYETYPIVSDPLPCTAGYLTGSTLPVSALIESTGTAEGWELGTAERHMQSEVTLAPVHGEFNKAIFSNLPPQITSNITVYGEDGNDADFISNSDWACQNSLTVYGTIYVQGTASMTNSCRTAVDLWANGNISMASSSRVDHDVKSSTGSITMAQNSSVGNNAVAGTTCTGCDTRVTGTVTTGNIQPAPPSTSFPEMPFDAAAWTDEGWTIGYYTNCTTARNDITGNTYVNQKRVFRITGGCTLEFSNNTTITRGNDLAIFTDGEIVTKNLTQWTSSSNDWHDLYLIVESAATCIGVDPVSGVGNGRVVMSNQTGFTRLYFFVYSPCYASFAQNNSTARGQLYGQTVHVANNLTYTFHAMLVPGAGDVTGYEADVKFKREVG